MSRRQVSKMEIIFFNFWHNGDLHLSRGIVRKIMEKVKGTSFTYSHKCAPNVLEDIPNLKYDSKPISLLRNPHDNLMRINDSIYINTWYGQQNQKYVNQYGTTFDCLYSAFDDTCKNIWGFSLADISKDVREFFPIIDYSKYNLDKTKLWLNNHPGHKILVENGLALSNQSNNFPMEPIIVRLANKYRNKIFILTNKINMDKPENVFFS